MLNIGLREHIRCTREEKLACVPLINEMVGLAKLARREGLLAFEKYKNIPNSTPLLRVGMELSWDGLDKESIVHFLEDMIRASDTTGVDLLRQFIIANGIVDILNGENPRIVRTHLTMMLGEEVYEEALEMGEEEPILLDRVNKLEDILWQVSSFLDAAREANEAYDFNTMDNDMLAFLLLHVGATLAAQIFETLDEQRRKDIIHVMLKIDFTKTEIITKIQDSLHKWKIDSYTYNHHNFLRPDNVRLTAQMLRLVSEKTRRDILDDIRETDNELYEKIKDSMFHIEDITDLNDYCFPRVLRELTSKDLATVILWRNNLKPVIFSKISGGLGDMIEDDLNSINASRDDFEAVVKKIAGVIRKLENNGDIITGWC